MNRDTDPGVMGLVLDRVMTDPAQWDLIQARLEDVPLADRDQLAAASREARGFTDAAVTAGIAAAAGKRQPWEVPEWVRLSLLTALVTWIQGKAVTCVHSPRPSRPEPVFAAGKPGLHDLQTVRASPVHRTEFTRGPRLRPLRPRRRPVQLHGAVAGLDVSARCV